MRNPRLGPPRRVAALLAVLLAVTLSGCLGSRRGPVEIDSLTVEDADRRLVLTVRSCHGDPEAEVVESDADRVVVRAVSTTPGPFEGGDDCLDGTRVELDEPLRDRCVVDATTGRRAGSDTYGLPDC